jgi:predicted DNA-binding ribbon-helix-helix protein
MCGIYSKADPILYESRTRSIRLHGVLTTIRLENLFWDVLTEMAAYESLTTNQLIVKLYDEVVERAETVNFASFLRVCCLRFLSLVAHGDLDARPRQATPLDVAIRLRSVGSADAKNSLRRRIAEEPARHDPVPGGVAPAPHKELAT